MSKKVRVRFAPSPTGGLHLGGVRTVLYNYLFAKQQGGDFVLRIEDTDQTRLVEGAEEYIFQCLDWAGLIPDESPVHGGKFGPYRQSERKEFYRSYAEKLVEAGHAYYAFDTPEEIEEMRIKLRTDNNPSPQYDHTTRGKMRNSLSLPDADVKQLLEDGSRYVIRIRMPENETVTFRDLVRDEVSFETSLVDDKVLLKADGMPTYHLAVVVDDFLMNITHAFRGEEWLPSAPVHILLWRYLFGEENMPLWAHLPLIMGPNGKLSKRDGAKYGFPVFPISWTDPRNGELTEGFKEKGFTPEGFINLLAILGWNDGSEQEIFSLDELIQKFSIDRVHKAGARFDYEKAKWFNHEWIKRLDVSELLPDVQRLYSQQGLTDVDEGKLKMVIGLVKDRCTLLSDFVEQGSFFFLRPVEYDLESVKPKWNEEKAGFFSSLTQELNAIDNWDSAFLESAFKQLATTRNIKPGDLQLPFRVMLVGGKFGPPVFQIAEVLGKAETIGRIENFLKLI